MRIILSFAVLAAGAASHAAILTNGDFESGATGFSSGYTKLDDLHPQGSYNVGIDPQDYHEAWSSFGDHTTGTGDMLIVNGGTTSDVEFWSEDVTLAQGDYVFSLWGASNYSGSPANVSVTLGGSSVGTTGDFSTTPGEFVNYLLPFSVATDGVYHLAMVDSNLAPGGNDFSVDDLTVLPQAVPEPTSIAALGVGALGLLRRRAKR